jgi:hypothetical protein
MKNIINLILFQFSWWTCILGTANNLSYIGPLFMLLFLVLHLFYLNPNFQETKFVILIALIGTLVDTSLAGTGLISYEGVYSHSTRYLAPLWITAMWAGFAATVNHSMYWLNNRSVVAFLLGAIFGPLSYLTGSKFDVIHFHTSILNILLILAIIWGVSIVGIFKLNSKITHIQRNF